jgi:hypothetical protein
MALWLIVRLNLPAPAKENIKREFDSLVSKSQWASETPRIEDLLAGLDRLDTAFVDWRYLHENMSRPLHVAFKPTIFWGEILHAACTNNFARSKAP